MLKSALVRVGDLAAVEAVPRKAPLVLDFGEAPFDAAPIHAASRLGHLVSLLVCRRASIADPAIDGFLRQNIATLVVLPAAPSLADALRRARELASPHVQVAFPLEKDADLTALKLLASLGVRTRLDVRGFRDGGERFADAMRDAILRPGRRAPVTPFEELLTGFASDETELAAFDLVPNARFAEAGAAGAAWEVEPPLRRRERLLLERHPCAYCEGLGFCNGDLYQPEGAERCKAAFSELVELHDVVRARQQARAQPRPPGREGAPC